MEENPKNYDDAKAINAALDFTISGLYLEYTIFNKKKVGANHYYSPDGKHFSDEYGQIFSVKVKPRKALPPDSVFRKLLDDYHEGIEVGQDEFDDFMAQYFDVKITEEISQHFKFQIKKSTIPYWKSQGYDVYRLWSFFTLFKPFYYININREIFYAFLRDYDHTIYPGKIG